MQYEKHILKNGHVISIRPNTTDIKVCKEVYDNKANELNSLSEISFSSSDEDIHNNENSEIQLLNKKFKSEFISNQNINFLQV